MFKEIKLGSRLLLRDWRGGELKILLLALVVAVTSMTSISLFIQRIDSVMIDQSGEFLGANLILQSPNPIQFHTKQKAESLNLTTSNVLSFSSVVVANNEFHLSHIKAVDKHYPLLSNIRVSYDLYGNEITTDNGPGIGEVWLVPRLFSLLQIKLGDQIEIGETRLKVTAVLKHDPGQAFSFMAIAPKLLMNLKDVEKTGIVKPGSRLNYMLGIAGAKAQRTTFEKWLTPKLNNSQKLMGGTEGSEAVNTAMTKGKQYLSLASMLSVMLSGIAIAIAANRYGERHYNQAALMRCLGAQQANIIRIFISQLFILGVLACTVGCLLGYVSQQLIAYLLKEYFNTSLPMAGLTPLLSGFISGLVTLFGFSLPSLLRLQSIPPLKVLREELTPLSISHWFVYGLAAFTIITVMWWQSGDLKLTMMVLTGTIACAIVLFFISAILVLISNLSLPVLIGPWKTGIQQIIRHRKQNQLQMLALGLSLMILMLILLIRSDLIHRWQNQLPEQAPNHFIINIQEYEVETIKSFLSSHSIQTEGIYPMVRGRITKINGQKISDLKEKKIRLDPSLKRELNLSWNSRLQDNNKITSGQWWSENTSGKPYISIEKGLAKRLNVDLGDSLTFKIANEEISASILNIRTVQWDSFQPNFFIVFQDNVINTYPSTYISSFYISSENKHLLNELIRSFPTVTILELDDIMHQVKGIMQQVSDTIGYVMLFVLFSGLIVLAASMQSSMDKRIHSAVIMRTLGASKSYLKRSHFTEFALLGFLSGLLAVISTEIISYFLYTRIFNLEFELHINLWVYGPVISSMLILFISRFYMKSITQLSPGKVLRYS